MKFILIGNYPPDQQESMQRYTNGLAYNLKQKKVSVEIWLPTVFFGRLVKSPHHGLGKWLNYIDKWLIFPIVISARLFMRKKHFRDISFHVCDHSNSPYLNYLPAVRSGITCHDVLAIRGAFGDKDAHCEASRTGKILQRWILSHLKKTTILTAVSHLTMKQLVELCEFEPVKLHAQWKVIYNTFNAEFKPMASAKAKKLLAAKIPENRDFILHVGSSLARKNRKMLLDMVHELGEHWNGVICYAGQSIDEALVNHARDLGLEHRLIGIETPSHEVLVALYSSCTAFVFPSFSEGFGWPLIEAQACGAPVLASNAAPMPEISNGSALHANPYDAASFAKAFSRLLTEKDSLIERGYENCKRFDPETLTTQFINLYKPGYK
ncbi:glycosyltransferase family 1 protein [Pedobacter frigiditerrae]|uniref:glycosyltransferase family 4 protein n=1 Tax=Pedobacter frigiditerrae TaxID=2530452 RepID=UPI00292E5E59|nr:glycosyltransferase family 1 protein [Pedobacter frigiditerrae]